MIKGFDTTANCGPLATKIKAAGYDFVARYYAHGVRKRLTSPEAHQLPKAGVKIVAIWEDASDQLKYFSHTRGVADSTMAYRSAMLIGQPAGTPIYFAVDLDAKPEAIAGAIADYFRGIADGFATMAGNLSPAYAGGVYGSGAVCNWIADHHLATYFWLAQATGRVIKPSPIGISSREQPQ